jgi:eukaryotic-like serine/threonine-protein kinase
VPVFTEGTLLDGRYRVLRHLGSGGMASVLLCQDERLDRLVAVKRLHSDSPADVERRFVREAKLGASLNHPNLVSVFDTATDDEGVLIVMEYVDGEALSQTLRRGALAPERVAAMVSDLGAALDHAHAQGVVHRDVKPGNVLLRRDGVTKLVDLGIATAADQTRITRSGTVLGTAAYMAPEQLEGGEPGPATDVYALGAVAYEALTGERARSGRTPVEIAHAIATSPPRDLRDAIPGASPAAAELLKRAMARDPADRPRSAGELARELGRALREEPPTAPTRVHATGPARAAAGPGRSPAGGSARSPAAGNARAPVAGSARAPAAGPGRSPARRPVGAIAVALVLLALAAAVVIAAVAAGGGDGERQADADRREQPATQGAGNDRRQGDEQPAQPAPAEAEQPAPEQPAQDGPAAEQQPADEAAGEQPAGGGPGRGAKLNERGFGLIQRGDYAAAVPVLERAVASWPRNSRDITYAYALFNLGQALNRSGRPDEAIPYLEKRLTWSDQTDAVQAELDSARENAAGG